ncbi:MAG: ABC transporter permease subunit [Oscillospiraceae bacterium]|nr:ABC transporter permease subunit [Oscillospiraceae bacterium]
MKKRRLFLLVPLLLLTLTGCFGEDNLQEPEVSVSPAESGTYAAEDFIGKRIAFATGEAFDIMFEENVGSFIPVHCIYEHEAMEMVKNGRADALILDEPMARKWVLLNPEMEIIYPSFAQYDFGVVFNGENDTLRLKFNDFLREIKENGVHADMTKRWLDTANSPPMPEIVLSGNNGILTFASAGEMEPFGYIVDNRAEGFDIEIAVRFAEYMDMDIDIQLMAWDALIPYVNSGKADFAAGLFIINKERGESVSFSEPYCSGGAVLITKKNESANVFRAEDFAGKAFAIITGSIWDTVLNENIPDAIQVHFNTSPETVLALRQGKVDATFTGRVLSERFKVIYPDLMPLFPAIHEVDQAFVFGKNNSELRESFNDFLREIHADGTYDDMTERWINTFDAPPMPDFPNIGNNGKLVFANTGNNDVFGYIQDGKPVGFEIELGYRFAEYMDMELEIQLMDFAGIIPAVQSGRIDFAGAIIAVTDERKQAVDFSDAVFREGILVTVRKESAVLDGAAADGSAESTGFWQSLKASFERNLIHENRWKMILEGLQVSMVITILSFALATLLGFGVCGLRMSKNRILNVFGNIYITVLRGTPIVVLLMITFYVIFAKTTIGGVTVAVIAFGANGAAFIGEIIRAAILTVDKGQVEAARSMGFSKVGAFFTVTFPQAVRVAFPVYMSEFISMFKMTAVVGYIAVVDLTKAGDIIRSRTYDAFFPLIMVALIYLITASIMIYLLNLINRKTNKRLRRDK